MENMKNQKDKKPDINDTQFLNLIKTYWKQNPTKSFADIIMMFIKTEYLEDRGISDLHIKETIMSDDECKELILKKCKEDDTIDSFFDVYKVMNNK